MIKDDLTGEFKYSGCKGRELEVGWGMRIREQSKKKEKKKWRIERMCVVYVVQYVGCRAG